MKRLTIARSHAVLLCAGLFLRVDRQARGDEDQDAAQRDHLMHTIQSELETIPKQLSGVAGASSTDGISAAIEQGRAMRRDVESLKQVKGSDSAANAIADHYLDYLERFDQSANALLTLKKAQLTQGERELWKRCAEEDWNLREAVKTYLDPPDPDGLEKVPDLADRAKGKIHDDYARQLDQTGEVARAYDDARRFSVSDGGWSDVSGRLREGADGSWSKYDERFKDTREKCAEIEKGKDNPYIVESLTKLKGARTGSKQVLDDILKSWGEWKQLRRDLAASYMVNADKVRMAICDGDNEHILSRVEDSEKNAQGNLLGGYQALDKQLDELIDRVSKLDGDKSVGAEARKWRGVMRGAKTRLTKVLTDGGILQGVQNAKVRARIEIGIKKHKDYQESSSNCTASEAQVSTGRIDCVKVDSGWCSIIEIKPNNDKAIAKGWDQVKRYRDNVLEAWRGAGTRAPATSAPVALSAASSSRSSPRRSPLCPRAPTS